MTDATNPTTTPAAAPTAPVSTTTIKLDGKEMELRGITQEQGLTIYGALPPHYKQMADTYAAIAKNYERVLKISLPQGMSFSQAWKNYSESAQKGVDFTHAKTDQYLKDLNKEFGGLPFIGALSKTQDRLNTAGNVLDGAGSIASDMFNLPGRTLDALGVVVQEASGTLGRGISDGQAKAFGAVFAAAALHESEVRKGLPVSFTSLDSLVVKYPMEALGAGFEHATSSVPIASDIWTLIVAAAKFVKSFFGDDKDLTMGQRWEKAHAEARAEQAEKNPGLTFDERLHGRVEAGEVGRAANKMVRAEVVAGLETKDRVGVMQHGGPFVAQDGATHVVEVNKAGKPVDKPLLGADGKPVGRGDRVVEAGSGLFPETAASLQRGDTGTVLGVAGGGALAGAAGYQTLRGGLEGAVRTYTGYDAKIADKAADKAAKLDAKAVRMEKGEAKFLERKADPELLREEAKAVRAKAVPNAAAAEDIANGVKHLADSESRAARMVGGFIEGSTESHSKWNVLRNGGRLIGDAFGGTLNIVRSSVATFVTDAAPIASGLGKGVTTVAKFARAIPGVGVVAGGGVMAFAASAHADMVNGKKLSYFEQLDYDHKQGKISDKEFAYYRSLQTGYIASGIGGLATAGVSEAVKVGLENIDPVKMEKYLPESIIGTVKGMVVGTKPAGALGAPDKGLAEAAQALHNASQERLAKAAASNPQAVANARMAANRTPFAKVTSSEPVGVADLGSFKLHGGLPQALQSVDQLSATPMA